MKAIVLAVSVVAVTFGSGAEAAEARKLIYHHGFLYRPLPEWVEPVVASRTSR